MDNAIAAIGALGVLGIGIGIVMGIFLSIIWLILPFAIFGIKPRLNEMIQLLKEIRNKQERLLETHGGTPGSKAIEELLK